MFVWGKTSFPREQHPQSILLQILTVTFPQKRLKQVSWQYSTVHPASKIINGTNRLYNHLNCLGQALHTKAVKKYQNQQNPPKTNSSYLTGSLPKRKLVFQPSIFRCELLVYQTVPWQTINFVFSEPVTCTENTHGPHAPIDIPQATSDALAPGKSA